MKAQLYSYISRRFQPCLGNAEIHLVPNLLLVFGAKDLIGDEWLKADILEKFGSADIVYCSTAGEICGTEVKDGTVIISALEFEKTGLQTALVNVNSFVGSREAGKVLADKLHKKDLCYIMILSDGAMVNGSELLLGIDDVFRGEIPVTGGLAGDGNNFQDTLVGLNENTGSGNIVAIGFYGTHLNVGHASVGGWDVFGPEKLITQSDGNILYEIDNRNALELYKEYLGKYADELPGSALLFPLSLALDGSQESVVRTILSIDEKNKTMTFAGDLPAGAKVRFMKANFDNLINAAAEAAQNASTKNMKSNPDYVLLISCVGRKIILKGRIEEEVEAVSEIFKTGTVMSGFYSYGELSPLSSSGRCRLHNQTMTITTFSEH